MHTVHYTKEVYTWDRPNVGVVIETTYRMVMGAFAANIHAILITTGGTSEQTLDGSSPGGSKIS